MTLTELSKKIGVSTATISRVINNENNVSEETKKLVEDAIKAHDYQYKQRKRTGICKNADTVLIIAGQVTNPITLQYIDGIRETLEPEKKMVFIAVSDYSEGKELEYLRYAKETGIAGIFMLNIMESDQMVRLLKSLAVPVILVNRYLRSMDTDLVTIDNYRCGYMSTRYLIDQGHRHIANLAGPVNTSITCQNRTQGYLDAMHGAGLPVGDDSIFYGDRSYQSGYGFGEKVAHMKPEERFTGIYCISGKMADGLADALKANGLSIPDDISLICNDDSNREYVRKEKITCVEPNHHSIGVAAGELFLDRMKNPDASPKRIVYPPVLSDYGSVRKLDAGLDGDDE